MRAAGIASVISAGLVAVDWFFMNKLSLGSLAYSNAVTLLVVSVVGLSLILFWFMSKAETKDDKGNSVNRSKLSASQVLYSAAFLLLFFFGGVSLNNLVIYLSAASGALLYFIGNKILRKMRTN